MAEYSRLAHGKVSSLGGATPVILPFQPDFVEFTNFTASGNPTSGFIPYARWDSLMGQGVATYQTMTAVTFALTTANASSNGISTFSGGLSFQYGPRKQIIGATAANPIVFNVTAHGYAVGDIVVFQGLFQSSTTGMPQITTIPFRISAVGDADHFSIVWPGGGSNYTALSGSPSGAYVQKVLYPFLYVPGVSFIEAITTGTTTTVVTTAPHNLYVGSQVAFRIPAVWGTVELNSLPNTSIPGSPIYGYVVSVTNSTTVVVSINSTGYTAFNTNQTVASFAVGGVTFPQMVAVGDINSGGQAISSGSALYPSPIVNGVSTINGPAINGAFINNTAQGFIIGSTIAGTAADVLYWRALIHDYTAM